MTAKRSTQPPPYNDPLSFFLRFVDATTSARSDVEQKPKQNGKHKSPKASSFVERIVDLSCCLSLPLKLGQV